MTRSLVELLGAQCLDAALIATEVAESDLNAVELFREPFLAVLPKTHALAKRKRVSETDLAPDLLVLADGHCLASQSSAAMWCFALFRARIKNGAAAEKPFRGRKRGVYWKN